MTSKNSLILDSFTLQSIDSIIDSRVCMCPIALGYKGKSIFLVEKYALKNLSKLQGLNTRLKSC